MEGGGDIRNTLQRRAILFTVEAPSRRTHLRRYITPVYFRFRVSAYDIARWPESAAVRSRTSTAPPRIAESLGITTPAAPIRYIAIYRRVSEIAPSRRLPCWYYVIDVLICAAQRYRARTTYDGKWISATSVFYACLMIWEIRNPRW